MKTWTLERLIDGTKRIVNQVDGLTDQAFTGPAGDLDLYFRDALNEAYDDEVEESKQNGDPRWFLAELQATWSSGVSTFTLPALVRGTRIERIADITSSYPGQELWVGDNPQRAQIHWRDRDTLWWGSSGPGSDRTILLTYCSDPETLEDPDDEPMLIANKFRHLLMWAAAMILVTMADQEAPSEWRRRRDDIRDRWQKFLMMGRPTQTGFVGVRLTDDLYP
jgi:hypothetical protein